LKSKHTQKTTLPYMPVLADVVWPNWCSELLETEGNCNLLWWDEI
jgi:hypothetical protein